MSLQGIVGFIDGTFHKCACPMHSQQADYNGWKHSHGMKYQGVMAPDGMFVHLGGLFRVTWHECKIHRQLCLKAMLDLAMGRHHGFHLYSDAAYGSCFPWVAAMGAAAEFDGASLDGPDPFSSVGRDQLKEAGVGKEVVRRRQVKPGSGTCKSNALSQAVELVSNKFHMDMAEFRKSMEARMQVMVAILE